jgi:hypothetical protein
MSRPLIVLTIVALLAACSGEGPVTAPPGSSTSLPVASTMDSAPIATTSTATSVVTSTTLTMDTSWLGEGWIAVGEELSPHPHAVTAAEFGLVAVGSACPHGGGCPAAAWVSDDGMTWTGTVPGEDGLGDVTLHEVVAFGSGVFAAGGSCKEADVHPDDCGATIFSSEDGLHWTIAAHDVFPDCTDADIPDCNMFAYRLATDGNTMVATVEEPVGGRRDSFPWVSTDGTEWTKAVSSDEAPLLIDSVIPTESGFVGVGTKWSTDGQTWWESFAVWDSPDGYAWSEVPGLAASDDEDIFLGPIGAWAGGLAAFGEVCDIDWVNCFRVIWASPDGQEWTRTPLQGETADITTYAFAMFGVEDLLTIAGVTEDTPHLAATRDLTNWDVQEVSVDGSNLHGPVAGLIRHDSLLIAVGPRVGLLINRQETN